MRISDGQELAIGLPDDVQLTDRFWSQDSRHFAFTNTTDTGVELWLASVDSKQARRLTGPELMAASGRPCRWMPNSDALLCGLIPSDRGMAPQRPRAPVGPTIQEAGGGQRAAGSGDRAGCERPAEGPSQHLPSDFTEPDHRAARQGADLHVPSDREIDDYRC